MCAGWMGRELRLLASHARVRLARHRVPAHLFAAIRMPCSFSFSFLAFFPGMTSAPPLDMRVVFTLGLVAATAATGAPGAMRLRGGGFNALVDMPGIQPRAAT